MSEPTEATAREEFEVMTTKSENADKRCLFMELVTTANTLINEKTMQIEEVPSGGKRHTLHINRMCAFGGAID